MTHRLMHEHVGKCAKMQGSKESQICGIKQARQAYQHRTEWRKVCIKHTNTTEMYFTSGYIQTSPRGIDVTTQASAPKGRQAQGMAKPRSRESSIDIKHRSKQTYICIKEIIHTL